MAFHVPEGPPQLTHLCDVHVDLGPPEIIGPVPEGFRMNVYVTGGWFRGPKLTGTLLPVGGDWLLLRNDGIGQLDVRATGVTDDGATIYTWYSGLLRFSPEQQAALLEGSMPEGPFTLNTAPMFRTADPRYAWLNHTLAVSTGWGDAGVVQYRWFAVTNPAPARG